MVRQRSGKKGSVSREGLGCAALSEDLGQFPAPTWWCAGTQCSLPASGHYITLVYIHAGKNIHIVNEPFFFNPLNVKC